MAIYVLMKFMQKMESEIQELKLAFAAITSAHSRAKTQVQGSHQSSANLTSVITKPVKSTGAQLLPIDRMNEHPPLPRRVLADEITDSSSCADQIEPADWQHCSQTQNETA